MAPRGVPSSPTPLNSPPLPVRGSRALHRRLTWPPPGQPRHRPAEPRACPAPLVRRPVRFPPHPGRARSGDRHHCHPAGRSPAPSHPGRARSGDRHHRHNCHPAGRSPAPSHPGRARSGDRHHRHNCHPAGRSPAPSPRVALAPVIGTIACHPAGRSPAPSHPGRARSGDRHHCHPAGRSPAPSHPGRGRSGDRPPGATHRLRTGCRAPRSGPPGAAPRTRGARP